jgi:hypothetical protein
MIDEDDMGVGQRQAAEAAASQGHQAPEGRDAFIARKKAEEAARLAAEGTDLTGEVIEPTKLEAFKAQVDIFQDEVNKYLAFRGDTHTDQEMYKLQFQAEYEGLSETLSHLCSLYNHFEGDLRHDDEIANSPDFERFHRIIEENKIENIF